MGMLYIIFLLEIRVTFFLSGSMALLAKTLGASLSYLLGRSLLHEWMKKKMSSNHKYREVRYFKSHVSRSRSKKTEFQSLGI